jgi:hypothetical protein
MPITARTVANVRAARHARINLAFTPGVCSSRVSAGSAASYQVRRFQLQCTSTQGSDNTAISLIYFDALLNASIFLHLILFFFNAMACELPIHSDHAHTSSMMHVGKQY